MCGVPLGIQQAYEQPFRLAADGEQYVLIKAKLTDAAYLDVTRRNKVDQTSAPRG